MPRLKSRQETLQKRNDDSGGSIDTVNRSANCARLSPFTYECKPRICLWNCVQLPQAWVGIAGALLQPETRVNFEALVSEFR